MKNLKEHPQVDKPRESLLEKAPDALSMDELLSLLLDNVIKSKKSKQLSEQIIGKFGNNFLNITVDDLLDIPEIGKAKALKIVTAFALIKDSENLIRNLTKCREFINVSIFRM